MFFNSIKEMNRLRKELPVDTRRRFNVYTTSNRRRIDVETTSCVYWEIGC